MATYNGITFLKEQIESILNQKKVQLTLFVSDDGSSDGTVEYIEALQKKHDIHLLEIIEPSGSSGANFFRLVRDVEYSGYDYVAYADQDDIWEEDKLIRAVNLMKERNSNAYSSDVMAFWPDGSTCRVAKSQGAAKWDHLFSSAGPGCTYVFDRELALSFKSAVTKNWAKLGNIFFHDWLIYAYARSHGFYWMMDQKIKMHYRQHDSNVYGANSGLQKFKTRWNNARNGWYAGQILSIASFCSTQEVEPIRLLKVDSYFSKLRLAFKVFLLRRSKLDALFLFFVLVVPGFRNRPVVLNQ